MFNKGKRYMTRGIVDGLDVYLQHLLWNIIDNMNAEKDYLQVFDIIRIEDTIVIEHSQEVPKYKNKFLISGKSLNFQGKEKIFCIDSEEYSMLMFSEEY